MLTNPPYTSVIIHYDQLQALHHQIDHYRSLTLTTTQGARNVAILGGPRSGRTTVINTYLKKHLPFETPHGKVIPACRISLQSPAVRREDIVRQGIQAIDSRASLQGSLCTLSTRWLHLLKSCKVTMILIDDFHLVINPKTRLAHPETMYWFSDFVEKSLPIMYVLVGNSTELNGLFNSFSRLNQLFRGRFRLNYFSWPENTLDHPFVKFVELFCTQMHLVLPQETSQRLSLMYKLYQATDGVMGDVICLLEGVAQLCQTDRYVTDKFLAEIYKQNLALIRQKPNPFHL